MLSAFGRYRSIFRRLLELVLLFAVARIIAGVAVVALFSRDAVAWGWELTLITVAAFAVCVAVALCVRRFSPASSL